jgi:hypothetical protein
VATSRSSRSTSPEARLGKPTPSRSRGTCSGRTTSTTM